jgi:hypothetical protein
VCASRSAFQHIKQTSGLLKEKSSVEQSAELFYLALIFVVLGEISSFCGFASLNLELQLENSSLPDRLDVKTNSISHIRCRFHLASRGSFISRP